MSFWYGGQIEQDSLDTVPEEAAVFMAGRTAVVGEMSGLTGETAIESGTGEEERGVDPVGVVLPLLGYGKIEGTPIFYPTP